MNRIIIRPYQTIPPIATSSRLTAPMTFGADEPKAGRGFGSDNYSGVHPEVFQALMKVNQGHVPAYGNDAYTKTVVEKFRKVFGKDIDVHFVLTGTGSNVLALSAITKPFNSIVCAKSAHIHADECGAPEKATGCQLLTVPTDSGKLTVEDIKPHVYGFGDQHHAQPKVISIAQSTELGSVYTPEEIKAIADFAHQNNMFLHLDGARLANAAVGQGVSLKEMVADTGVDVLSFGGTKNGLMFGEAVIFFKNNRHRKNPALTREIQQASQNFPFIRKQGTQLYSKMRFIAAQFDALLTNDLWQRNAQQANGMAQLLAQKLKAMPQVKLSRPVDSNAVFATLPNVVIPALQQQFPFYVWTEGKEQSEVRWMASFDTTAQDLDGLVAALKKGLKNA